jgi:bla regulator protein blaR1
MNMPSELFRIAAHVFFAGLWQGAVLTLAVALALRLCSRVGPQLRFAVWAIAFAGLLATPLLNLQAHFSSTGTHAASVQLSESWEYAITVLWFILMSVRAVQLIVHMSRLQATWRRATPIRASESISKLLQRSRRSVELCISADVDSPSVIGFLSPRLLIPEWLVGKLSPEDMAQIVLHELEHLRRMDDWLNLIQKVGLVLFPLNPGLFWVDHKLSVERELACDAGVVASTTQPLAYARCLTRVAEHRSIRRKLALSLAAWGHQSELGRRVLSLLQPANTWSSRHARFATALLILLVAGCGAEMARVPHLVTFADAHSAGEPHTTAAVTDSQSAVPAVYSDTAQPRATLLKAVMRPAPAAESPVAQTLRQPTVSKAQVAKQQRPHHGMLRAAARTAGVERTNPYGGKPIQAVYVLPDAFSPSYAAVSFADGWLIVQL